MAKISKKIEIMNAALKLFSKMGYEAVGVDLIASEVGMKGPSLYYYFKKKEDILDELINQLSKYYEANFVSVDNKRKYPESIDELIEISMKRVLFSIRDEKIIMTRKLLMIEQFRNKKLSEVATKHNLTVLIELYVNIFEHMMEAGIIKKEDPEILAFEFVAPVTVLIQLVDREPDREEEALLKIRKHMDYFAKTYGL